LSQGLAAAVAELLAHRIRLAAAGARHVTGQARAALATEAGAVGIRVVAAGAFHRTHQLAAEAPTAGATDGSTPCPPPWPRGGSADVPCTRRSTPRRTGLPPAAHARTARRRRHGERWPSPAMEPRTRLWREPVPRATDARAPSPPGFASDGRGSVDDDCAGST